MSTAQTFAIAANLIVVTNWSVVHAQLDSIDARSLFCDALYQYLRVEGVSDSALDALSDCVPMRIVHHISQDPEYINFELACIPVPLRHGDSSFVPSKSEVFCGCSDGHGLTYVVILKQNLNGWESIWDTTLHFSCAPIGLMHQDLGIGKGSYPTLHLMESWVWGVTNWLIEWNGVAGRFVSDATRFGPQTITGWFEPIDMNGDGVMELSVQDTHGPEALHGRVWTFDQRTQQYRLDSALSEYMFPGNALDSIE